MDDVALRRALTVSGTGQAREDGQNPEKRRHECRARKARRGRHECPRHVYGNYSERRELMGSAFVARRAGR